MTEGLELNWTEYKDKMICGYNNKMTLNKVMPINLKLLDEILENNIKLTQKELEKLK